MGAEAGPVGDPHPDRASGFARGCVRAVRLARPAGSDGDRMFLRRVRGMRLHPSCWPWQGEGGPKESSPAIPHAGAAPWTRPSDGVVPRASRPGHGRSSLRPLRPCGPMLAVPSAGFSRAASDARCPCFPGWEARGSLSRAARMRRPLPRVAHASGVGSRHGSVVVSARSYVWASPWWFRSRRVLGSSVEPPVAVLPAAGGLGGALARSGGRRPIAPGVALTTRVATEARPLLALVAWIVCPGAGAAAGRDRRRAHLGRLGPVGPVGPVASRPGRGRGFHVEPGHGVRGCPFHVKRDGVLRGLTFRPGRATIFGTARSR